MKTLEMMNEAKNTNKTYMCELYKNNLRYSNKFGFYSLMDNSPIETNYFNSINELMSEDTWKFSKPVIITKKQIESELGYEITIINCLNCIYSGSYCNKCENYNKHSLRKDW